MEAETRLFTAPSFHCPTILVIGKVAKIVHCGLSRLHVALADAYAPMLATRSLGRFRHMLPETEQFRRRRQQKVAKIVQCGEHLS